MKIAVLKERAEGETRVALTPETAKKFIALGADVAIEAGATGTWWRWAGSAGAVIGIDTFGVSAPAEDAYQHFDLTSDRVAKTLRALAN